ncbi:pore-forming ESAT-6 family protein [Neorhizobium sp. NPDC001467]|uniref:pore-forming ESAT-6 family protein n=1 Tax=Neorhizobium sp. NPDC001467 TaxID=3390595 RepID=UPI003D0427DD
MKRTVLIGVSALAFSVSATASPAFGQATNEQMEMAYNSARNQLGVLKYCQNQGHIDGEAAAVQTKLIALIPAPANTDKGDEAEKTGERGTIAAMGVNQDLAASAKAQNVTEKQFCDVVANAIKQVATQLPK